VLDKLRFEKDTRLEAALDKYTDYYNDVYGAVKEPYLRKVRDRLGPDPAAVSGPRALTEETVRNLQLWFDYDLRWLGFRLLRLGHPPREVKLERIGPSDKDASSRGADASGPGAQTTSADATQSS
jgi:hypothetical protein